MLRAELKSDPQPEFKSKDILAGKNWKFVAEPGAKAIEKAKAQGSELTALTQPSNRFELTDDNEFSYHSVDQEPAHYTVSMQSERLKPGEDFPADQPLMIEAAFKNSGIEQGVYRLVVTCYNEAGKTLQQFNISNFSPNSAKSDWRRTVSVFGAGTERHLPEGTDHLLVRLVFEPREDKAIGHIQAKNIKLVSYEIPGNKNWPFEFSANVGDLQVRFDSSAFWSLYRIDHEGTRLAVDRRGSLYGTVANFPGVGFIGTGHVENEDEEVLSVSLEVDGKPVPVPPTEITCQKLVLKKTSRIRSLNYHITITIENNTIREATTLTASQATPVNLIYHFMHPWVPSADYYMAELLDGKKIEGKFIGDGKHRVDSTNRWSAIYDSSLKKGAVTRVVKAPEIADHWKTFYWDVENVYRKHYLVTFRNQTIPADQEFAYEVLTIPFSAELEAWQQAAEKVAVDQKIK